MSESGTASGPRVSVESCVQPNGALVLRNSLPCPAYAATLTGRLDHWAREARDRVFLGERSETGEWRTVTYGAAGQRVADLASRILSLGLGAETPLMMLGANSINQGLVMLAAMRIGVPAAVISPAYARSGAHRDRLNQIVQVCRPGALYVDDPRGIEPGPDLANVPWFAGPGGGPGLMSLDDLDNSPAHQLEEAVNSVGPDTTAKLLFTSGSTGGPKGVINTHRMMCSNQAALSAIWPFLEREPPRLVDWLPWNHTFGGNVCFNIALHHGGSLYIDDGRPTPEHVGRTLENIADIRPNLYFNVPAGYEAMLPELERNPSRAAAFLDRLQMIFSAGAALPSATRSRLQDLVRDHRGSPVPVWTGWGSTETAPFATAVYFSTDQASNIGVPIPGVEIKLVPDGGKLEMRVRGPNVTPGYWRQTAVTAAAFDPEGYFHIGDAGRLADPARPEAGLLFEGRVAENFKLASGTWVDVGALRLAIIAAAGPMVRDAVIVGHDRLEVGALLVPDIPACRAALKAIGVENAGAAVLENSVLMMMIQDRLRRHNAGQIGSSTRIGRFAFLPSPPSLEDGEITEKGYINQRAMIQNRATDIERLFASHASAESCVV